MVPGSAEQVSNQPTVSRWVPFSPFELQQCPTSSHNRTLQPALPLDRRRLLFALLGRTVISELAITSRHVGERGALQLVISRNAHGLLITLDRSREVPLLLLVDPDVQIADGIVRVNLNRAVEMGDALGSPSFAH